MAQAAPITENHLPLLLQAAQESRYPTRDLALVMLLVELGPRPCELASLTWKALVDASGALTGRMVWKSKKGGDVRDEPLSAPTLAAIAELHKTFRIESINRPIFTTQRNGPFKDQSMRSHIISLCQSVHSSLRD